MPQVVEAERTEVGLLAGAVVAPAQRRGVEVRAAQAGEHEVVGADEVLALAELCEAGGDGVDQRQGAATTALRDVERAVRVAGVNLDRLPVEVDLAPAKRKQLAHAQAGERGGQEHPGVLLARRRAHEPPHFLAAVDVDVDPLLARLLLDLRHRVRRKPVELARPLEDAVQHRQDLVDRLVGEPALCDDLGAPGVDYPGRNFLKPHMAEGRQQVGVDC